MTATTVRPALAPLTDVGSVTATGAASELEALYPPGLTVTIDDTFGTGGSLDTSTPDTTNNTETWSADAGWSNASGSSETTDTTESVALIDLTAADAVVTVDLTWGFGDATAKWNGIAVRGDSVADDYLVFRPDGWDGTRRFALDSYESGAFVETLARFPQASVDATSGVAATVEAYCEGALVTFRVDGVFVGGYDAAPTAPTEFGIWSNEQSATPAGSVEDFVLETLDTIDDAYLRATASGVVRYYAFAPPVPSADTVPDYMTVTYRQARTGAGYWRARIGVVDTNGEIVYGPQLVAPISVPTDGTVTERGSVQQLRTQNGFAWPQDPTTMVVRVLTETEDADTAFGNADLTSVKLTFGFNGPPSAGTPTVDLDGSAPLVSWNYSDPEDDLQTMYEVRAWLPATIAAAEAGADLEDIESVYRSGLRTSQTNSHRVAEALTPATLHTFGVRVYHRNVANQTMRSEWATVDGTTDDGIDATPTVALVTTAGTATVTVSDLGIANTVSIERSVDGAAFEPVAALLTPTTARTRFDVDTFTRSDGAIGSTEADTPSAWTVDTGPSTTSTTAIDTNRAEINGDGGATVTGSSADCAVRATVDTTGGPVGVRARAGATGFTDAVVDSSGVALRTFDSGDVAHAANTVTATHDVGTSALIELVCSGDEYLVLVDGAVVIRNIDATAPNKAETGVGIGSGNQDGVAYVERWEAFDLDHEVVWDDPAAPQTVDLQYRALAYLRQFGRAEYGAAKVTTGTDTIDDPAYRLSDPLDGTALTFNPERFDFDYSRPVDPGVPIDSGVPDSTAALRPPRFSVELFLESQTDFDTLINLLSRRNRLAVSDVFGNAWEVYATGGVQVSPVVVQPAAGAVAHHYRCRFALQALTL